MPSNLALFLPIKGLATALARSATLAAGGSDDDDDYGWIGYESALPAPHGAPCADDRSRGDGLPRLRPDDPA
jgi:hypothetical protein